MLIEVEQVVRVGRLVVVLIPVSRFIIVGCLCCVRAHLVRVPLTVGRRSNGRPPVESARRVVRLRSAAARFFSATLEPAYPRLECCEPIGGSTDIGRW